MDYVRAGGHRLELKRIDPGVHANEPPGTLIFLHEGLGSAALWKDFPERVAQRTGCPAVVYSRYGYGKSDRLERAHSVDYMHREALDTLPELLSQLAIEDPILIGHSDGASIALIYAGAQRGPLRGLVAMAPHVFVEDVTAASIAQAKVAFETTDLPQRLGRYHDDPVSTFYGWNDIWLHPEFRAWNIEACLAKIAVPILLIQGEDDQYGTRAQVDAIARQVSGPVEVLMLDQCRHSPHGDRAEATAEAIAVCVGKLRYERPVTSDLESVTSDGWRVTGDDVRYLPLQGGGQEGDGGNARILGPHPHLDPPLEGEGPVHCVREHSLRSR